MPRGHGADDPLVNVAVAAIVAVAALYFLGILLALIPIYAPWVLALPVGAAAGGIAGAILRRRPPQVPPHTAADWRRRAGWAALVGGALLAFALLAPSGMGWLSDYDDELRTKPAAQLRAETDRARAEYRRDLRAYRRDELFSRPDYERPSPRWALTDAEKFNDIPSPVWRWVSAGLGALLLAGAVVVRRMLGRAQPAPPPVAARAAQYGGLT